MDAAVRRYRVMAYITGTVLIVLCFVGIPLQVVRGNDVIVNDVGTLHGILYIIYLVTAYHAGQAAAAGHRPDHPHAGCRDDPGAHVRGRAVGDPARTSTRRWQGQQAGQAAPTARTG